MMTVDQAKKFVSVTTYNQLNKLLYTLEHVTSPRDIARTQEKLRESMEKLFTYKEIFELHSDHILELAETVAGLYPERTDLNGYVYYILKYIDKKIARYENTCIKYKRKLRSWSKVKDTNPDGYLNLRYEVWTYTEGYYHQQAHMYRLLQRTLKELLYYAERGDICRRKNT